MNENYNDYLKTEYWQTVSKAVKARAGWRCQLCNSQHDLCAHHRTYDHRGSELDHLDDLTCLCRRCHEIFHGKLQITEKPKAKAKSKKTGVKLGKYEYNHASDMPEGDPIILSRELVNRLRTKGGSFTNATLAPIGLKFPLKSGWMESLEGKQVSRRTYWAALEGREVYRAKLLS